MPECPAPDCDYSNPSMEAVKGHWGGSQDAQHAGKWHEAMEAYEEARGATAAEAQGEATRTGASEGTPDGHGGGPEQSVSPQRLELPSQDEPARDGADGNVEDTLSCPECGGDRGEKVSSLTQRLREADTKQSRSVLKRYDWTAVPNDAWVCGVCWESGEITVYANET